MYQKENVDLWSDFYQTHSQKRRTKYGLCDNKQALDFMQMPSELPNVPTTGQLKAR